MIRLVTGALIRPEIPPSAAALRLTVPALDRIQPRSFATVPLPFSDLVVTLDEHNHDLRLVHPPTIHSECSLWETEPL